MLGQIYQSHGPEESKHGDGGSSSPDLGHDDVQEGADHDHKVEVVPGVLHILPHSKTCQLEDEFKGEEDGEDQVHDVKEVRVSLRLEIEVETMPNPDTDLIVESHGQEDCIDANSGKDEVLKEGAGDESPNLRNIQIMHHHFSAPCTAQGHWE